MLRLFALVGFLAAISLAGIGSVVAQDAATDSAASLTRTDTRYVVPYGPDGLNAALTVTSSEDGTCTPDSIAAPDRPDAWDCISESNQIYDPCFENPFAPPDGPGEVACFDSPFSSEVVVLTVADPLPRAKDAPPGAALIAPWDLPWGLELANGDRCVLLYGTEMALAGMTAYYSCADGGTVLGDVDRSLPVWTVNYLADGDVASGLVAVSAAWS